MKKRMLALVLAGVLSSSMGMSALAADSTQNGEENAVISEITAEEEESAVVDEEEVPSDTGVEEDVAETPETEVPDEVPSEPADATEEVPADAAEAEEPGNDYTGWYEKDGITYYYVNGEMLTGGIYEIEDVWYMFDYDGWLWKNAEAGFYNEESSEYYTYRSDSEGKLISGWYEDWEGVYYFYSLESYYRYENQIFEYDGKLYYVNYQGKLAVSQNVYFEDKVYAADAEGVLTEKDEVKDGWLWIKDDGVWYYFKDGKAVKDQICTIEGKKYYFDENGVMRTGSFGYYDNNTEEYGLKLAETDGHLVEKTNAWYKYKDSWYYFKADGWLADGEFLKIDGKDYYFTYGGILAIGLLYTEGEYYITDSNGAIIDKVTENGIGWREVGNDWYYFKDAQNYVRNELIDIDGKRYYFDWDGKMQKGYFSCYNEMGNYESYYTDSSGAILKNQWINDKGVWRYASNDYALYEEGKYTIEGKQYIFNYYQMQTGKVGTANSETGEYEYYLTDESGAILTGKGWKYRDLQYYYLDENGKILTNQWIDGHYYVNYDGVMIVGTYYIEDGLYYFDSNGYCREELNADFEGWKFVDGYWYYHDESGDPFTGWVDGTYYIDDGAMLTNQIVQDENGDLYYLRYDGKFVKGGWYRIENDYNYMLGWVYANSNGKLVKDGWKQIGKTWYYFYNGIAAQGKTEIEGKTEFFDEKSCAWIWTDRKGWEFINNEWYYFKEDGTLLEDVDSAVIDGVTYYFWYYGAMRSNNVVVESETNNIYYLDANGYRHTFKGWKQVGRNWYYADANHKAAEGLKYLDGAYYYFRMGRMQTGRVYVDAAGWGDYYFFNDSGKYQNVKNGWVSLGSDWYYYINGKPVKNQTKTINGVTYAFHSDGVMATGRYYDFVFDNSGKLLRNAWYQFPHNNLWTYADASGRAVYGERTIGGKQYWFSGDGIWIK